MTFILIPLRFSACIAILACGLATFGAVSPTRAALFDLSLDIGVADGPDSVGASPNDVYGTSFEVAGHSAGFEDQGDVSSATQVFGGVGVTLLISQGEFFDSAQDVSDTWWGSGDLSEDGIYTNGGEIYVTLSNLPAGKYSFTGYHHNPEGTEFLYPTEVWVNSGAGYVLGDSNFFATFGYAPGAIETSEVEFWTDGSDVSLMIYSADESLQQFRAFLNGFDLVQTESVPEPSTWLLMACGVAALGVVRSRRRRRD